MRTIRTNRGGLSLDAFSVAAVTKSSCVLCARNTPRMVEVRRSGATHGAFYVFCQGCVTTIHTVSLDPVERDATTPTATREGILS